jgi:hypothetical protein
MDDLDTVGESSTPPRQARRRLTVEDHLALAVEQLRAARTSQALALVAVDDGQHSISSMSDVESEDHHSDQDAHEPNDDASDRGGAAAGSSSGCGYDPVRGGGGGGHTGNADGVTSGGGHKGNADGVTSGGVRTDTVADVHPPPMQYSTPRRSSGYEPGASFGVTIASTVEDQLRAADLSLKALEDEMDDDEW